MREQRGIFGERAVEKFGGRVRVLGERGRVVAEAHDPFAGRCLPRGAKGPQPFGDFGKGLRPVQVAEQQRLRERRDMAVAVDETRQQRVPL